MPLALVSKLKLIKKSSKDVHRFNCVKEFLDGRITVDGVQTPPLKLVTCPELKRKIIGDTFMFE